MNRKSYCVIIFVIFILYFLYEKNKNNIESFHLNYRPIHYYGYLNNTPNIVLPPTFNRYRPQFQYSIGPYPYYLPYSYYNTYPYISMNAFCTRNPYSYPCPKWKYIY